MQPGIYDNLSNAEYHGGPGISKSGLDLIARSPLHFKAARDSANDRVPTPAQLFGTAFHSFILEPGEFHKEYCLGLRRSDVPDAIEDRDVLVGMVQELNKGRLPKLPTTGTKDELIWRITEELGPFTDDELEAIKAEKQAALKDRIVQANVSRPGLLPLAGSRHELSDLLRSHGKDVTLWSDVLAAWNENNAHRAVLTQEQWDTLHAMREAVEAHPAASKLLSAPGVAERSVYWTDPITGELCRCRPDFWRNDGVIVDVKTCEDASPEAFARSIDGWRYHVQDAMYRDGVNIMREQANRSDIAPIKAFVFLAVEKKFPHAVGVYVLDAESLEVGRQQYQRDLLTYHECNQADQWPGYSEKIASISLPAWALAKAAA